MKNISILLLIAFLFFSCSSANNSILETQKGQINFLEGDIKIFIGGSESQKFEPYVFNLMKKSMPDVNFSFVKSNTVEIDLLLAKIYINDRYTESDSRSYDYDKCIDFNYKKFKCLEYRNTRMYCSSHMYKSDVSFSSSKNGNIESQYRELITSRDEKCSESYPSPKSYNDLGIENDFYVAQWIVESIARTLLDD